MFERERKLKCKYKKILFKKWIAKKKDEELTES